MYLYIYVHTYICVFMRGGFVYVSSAGLRRISSRTHTHQHNNNTLHTKIYAVDTYSQFCDENEALLKRLPPPKVAIEYYVRGDLFLFDEFQTSRPAYSRYVSCIYVCIYVRLWVWVERVRGWALVYRTRSDGLRLPLGHSPEHTHAQTKPTQHSHIYI